MHDLLGADFSNYSSHGRKVSKICVIKLGDPLDRLDGAHVNQAMNLVAHSGQQFCQITPCEAGDPSDQRPHIRKFLARATALPSE
jgi:hypothetical protein